MDLMDVIDEEEQELEKNFEEELSKINCSLIPESEIIKEKKIGEGAFGKVYKGTYKNQAVAIKKIKLVEKAPEIYSSLVNEIKVIKKADTPEIPKFYGLMKKNGCYRLIFEYISGKTFKEVYPTMNYDEKLIALYKLSKILDSFHSKLIIHRDIKPSNIMIDSNGYLKMIDFGTAKVLKDYTSTIIGTPHYIAPEILQGKGYSLSCDFWSLGICMYEIFYGIYPFGHTANEVIDIYKEVLKKNLSFPSESSKYQNINAFIRDLLAKKVNERVCNVSKLKQKPFFENFDFSKLNDFQLEPPYKPEKKDLSKFLIEKKEPYENIFKNEKDTFSPKKKKTSEEDEDSDYDPNWIEAF